MDDKSIQFEAIGRQFTMRLDVKALQLSQKLGEANGCPLVFRDTLAVAIWSGGQRVGADVAESIINDLGLVRTASLFADAYQAGFPNGPKVNRAARRASKGMSRGR